MEKYDLDAIDWLSNAIQLEDGAEIQNVPSLESALNCVEELDGLNGIAEDTEWLDFRAKITELAKEISYYTPNEWFDIIQICVVDWLQSNGTLVDCLEDKEISICNRTIVDTSRPDVRTLDEVDDTERYAGYQEPYQRIYEQQRAQDDAAVEDYNNKVDRLAITNAEHRKRHN